MPELPAWSDRFDDSGAATEGTMPKSSRSCCEATDNSVRLFSDQYLK